MNNVVRWSLVLCLLLCLLFPAAALGEAAVVHPFPEGSAEALLASMAAEQPGLPLQSAGPDDPAAAVNRMLADPESVLCDTQQALILSLQGYTDKDLREDLTPVCRLAVSPLYLVMDSAAAADFGVNDAASLLAYVREHEYELNLARRIDADPVDRAAVSLTDQLPLLTDIFTPEEVPEALKTGAAAAAVVTGADLAASLKEENLLVLFTLGDTRTEAFPDLPCAPELGLDPVRPAELCLFLSSAASEDLVGKLAGITLPAGETLPLGYEPAPLSGEAFAAEIADLFADYKKYMTAEGLFFYEE